MKRRLIALLLCIAMIGSMTVYAVGDDPVCTCGTETEEHAADCALLAEPAPEPDPVCTCGTATEEHGAECALYVAPAPVCTCGTATEEHAAECPLYVAPAPVCTCGVEDDLHTAECALYVEPVCPVCTCGTTSDFHDSSCPMFIDVGCTCGTQTDIHTEECPCYVAPECTCGSTGDGHAEECDAHTWGENGIPSTTPYTNVATMVRAPKRMMFKSVRNTFTPVDNDAIITSKIVSYNETTDDFTIKLESHVTGSSVTTETEETRPADIVLVIDMTGSMRYCIKCGYKFGYASGGPSKQCPGGCTPRVDAMRDAVEAFLQKVESSEVDHRVAVVPFARYTTNTGVFYHDDGSDHPKTHLNFKGVTSSTTTLSADQYSRALLQLNTGAKCDCKTCKGKTFAQQIMTWLNDDDYVQGGTYPGYGMTQAKQILANSKPLVEGEQRDKMIVFLSDGIPSTADTTKTALEKSAECASSYGATIYTVGIFLGADASNPTNLSFSTSDYGYDNENTVDTANTFMHLLSSNYPNAKAMTTDPSGYVAPANGGYYLSTNDTSDLTTIFTKIADQVTSGGSSITLDTKTEVRDEISKDFEIVYDAGTGEPKINFYTMSYTEKDTWVRDTEVPSGVTATVTDGVVSVTGFDYAENWVGEHVTTSVDGTVTTEYRGKKLVVEIGIDESASNQGGIMLPTNVPGNSGIFVDGTAMENFDQPAVDVAACSMTLIKNGQELYDGDTFDFTVNYVEFSGYVESDNNPYGLEAVGQEATRSATLGIDDEQKFGWCCTDDTCPADVIQMKPLVGSEISFTEAANPDYEITSVTVSYEENGATVTDTLVADSNGVYTTTVRPNMTVTFTNIPTKADLVITKKVDTKVPAESFMFHVSGEGVEMNVLIPSAAFVNKEGQVVIKNLQVGDYTITELVGDGAWNWRYNMKSVSAQNDSNASTDGVVNGISFRLTADGETVAFVNEYKNDFWLSGDSWCRNLWGDNSITATKSN